ncbi:MAG: hypothetical protein DRO09_01745 [Thermoprotei archaeon]|nr:MAG: hypothetical protein DRO09_01745 [Thermoprotei archaeon]
MIPTSFNPLFIEFSVREREIIRKYGFTFNPLFIELVQGANNRIAQLYTFNPLFIETAVRELLNKYCEKDFQSSFH